MRYPDFMIIGAMKCATSTLHEQIGKQPGFALSDPKELYFFSDDPVYAKGHEWYLSHFAHAKEGDIIGESTTHYTKLPTYPHTIERIKEYVPNGKFIYVMRHPLERLVSQYIHQWTEREISIPIDEAVHNYDILKAYSNYPMQLKPWFDAFGQENVLPVFFDRLKTHPQAELERVCQFIGYDRPVKWDFGDEARNVSAERMRANPLRDAVVNFPPLAFVRKNFIPQSIRDKVKEQFQMQERPELSPENVAMLTAEFDQSLAILGSWLGVGLNCENYKAVTRDQELNWM